MVVASFIILTCSLFYDSYMQKGEIVDMLELYKFFVGTKTVVSAWLALVSLFFLIILVTKFALRHSAYFWIPLYILHIALMISIATYFSQQKGLGFGSVMIIMAEAIRMIMKAHSYLRTKLVYLTNNPYKNFEFRGVRVINISNNDNINQNSEDGKYFKINIK